MRSPSDNPFKQVILENNSTLKQEYRLLTIKSIMRIKDSGVIELGFEEFENHPYTIEIDLDLFPKNTNTEKLIPGNQIFVKGKNGNSDHMLWGYDKIKAIQIARHNNVEDIQTTSQNDVKQILPFVKSDK
jgi:hypothetical protein